MLHLKRKGSSFWSNVLFAISAYIYVVIKSYSIEEGGTPTYDFVKIGILIFLLYIVLIHSKLFVRKINNVKIVNKTKKPMWISKEDLLIINIDKYPQMNMEVTKEMFEKLKIDMRVNVEFNTKTKQINEIIQTD